MHLLRRLIGLGIGAIFVLGFPVGTWTYHLQEAVFDTSIYKEMFVDQGFYADLVPAVLPALLEGLEDQNPEPGQLTLLQIIENTPTNDWEDIAPTLVPIDWVEYEVETNLDAFARWIDGEADDLDLVFHTETVRRRLLSSSGEEALRQVVATWPACSPDDLDTFDQFAGGNPAVAFPFCCPGTPEANARLEVMVQDAVLRAADTLPNALDVVGEMEQHSREHVKPGDEPFTRTGLARFRAGMRLWDKLFVLNLLLPVALLSLVVIAVIRSFKSFFRWIGWLLILGSVATLLPLLSLPFIINDITFEHEIEGGFAAGGALLAEIVGARTFHMLLDAFTWPVLIQCAVLMTIGFVFAVISVILNDLDAPPELTYAASLASTGSAMQAESSPAAEASTRLDNTPPDASTSARPTWNEDL
jgi:hypothetical protein